jgi:hypothetical protein
MTIEASLDIAYAAVVSMCQRTAIWHQRELHVKLSMNLIMEFGSLDSLRVGAESCPQLSADLVVASALHSSVNKGLAISSQAFVRQLLDELNIIMLNLLQDRTQLTLGIAKFCIVDMSRELYVWDSFIVFLQPFCVINYGGRTFHRLIIVKNYSF